MTDLQSFTEWLESLPAEYVRAERDTSMTDEYESELVVTLTPKLPRTCGMEIWVVREDYVGFGLGEWKRLAADFGLQLPSDASARFFALFAEPRSMPGALLRRVCETVSEGAFDLRLAIRNGVIAGSSGKLAIPELDKSLHGVGGGFIWAPLSKAAGLGDVRQIHLEPWVPRPLRGAAGSHQSS